MYVTVVLQVSPQPVNNRKITSAATNTPVETERNLSLGLVLDKLFMSSVFSMFVS